MKEWTHPRIANPDCAIFEHDAMAGEARAAFARRRDAYPEAVRAQRITAEDARADLEAWRAIAKDWTWIAFGDGAPAAGDTLHARIQALDTAIARWLDLASQNGGNLTQAEDLQGLLLCAMRWWAERERHPYTGRLHARDLAGIGHNWRAENGHPTRGAMLAAKQSPIEPERKAA